MKPFSLTPAQIKVISALIVAALVGLGVVTVDTGEQPQPPTATATPTPASAPLRAIALPPLAGGEHHDLAETGDVATGLPRGAARAGDTIRGCVTDFNQHNFSGRGGAKPLWIVGHWTGSANRPGWADVFGNQVWLDSLPARASANFIIDGEGHCVYTVPITMKAWTQANANPHSVSIEFVATGGEGGLTKAAAEKGGLVAGQVARELGIPIRLSAGTDCAADDPGFRDHESFGVCGGGHPDLGSWSLAGWIGAARAGGITATDRVTCRKLNWWRQHGRPHGKAEQNAVRRRQALAARGVRCERSGPVLTG